MLESVAERASDWGDRLTESALRPVAEGVSRSAACAGPGVGLIAPARENGRAFSVERRDALREQVLQLAKEDDRVVAAAAVGSLAVDEGDQFSDLDLTFGTAEPTPVAVVLDDWTTKLADERDAVTLVDLERDLTVYRVLLFPDALQLDLSMTPAGAFRPSGPRFQLIFGKVAAGEPRGAATTGTLFIPTPAVAEDLLGWGGHLRPSCSCVH